MFKSRINFSWRIANCTFASWLITSEPSSKDLKEGEVSSVPLLASFLYELCNNAKSDFALSNQVSAEAKTVKVLGIDWSRIFMVETGEVNKDGSSSAVSAASIPVIGSFIGGDRTESYALYELMKSNPGYDVVFYPQFETKKYAPGLGLFYNVTTVKATARLGKMTE